MVNLESGDFHMGLVDCQLITCQSVGHLKCIKIKIPPLCAHHVPKVAFEIGMWIRGRIYCEDWKWKFAIRVWKGRVAKCFSKYMDLLSCQSKVLWKKGPRRIYDLGTSIVCKIQRVREINPWYRLKGTEGNRTRSSIRRSGPKAYKSVPQGRPLPLSGSFDPSSVYLGLSSVSMVPHR